jgi:hypothetical protein
MADMALRADLIEQLRAEGIDVNDYQAEEEDDDDSDDESETVQALSSETFAAPLDNSPCIDESDPDQLLELDDLFAGD